MMMMTIRMMEILNRREIGVIIIWIIIMMMLMKTMVKNIIRSRRRMVIMINMISKRW